MIFNFVIPHLFSVVMALRIVLVALVAIRFFRPVWLRNISYKSLAIIVALFDVAHGLFLTWAQYHVWAISDPTGTYIKFSYFSHYVWTNFWLGIVISFVLSGIVYAIFKIWSFYRGGFIEKGPELMFALMLATSYPGILIFLPVGFVFSIIYFIYLYIRGESVVHVESAFIWAAFIGVIFARVILYLHVL